MLKFFRVSFLFPFFLLFLILIFPLSMVSISNPFFLTRIESEPIFKNSQTINDEYVESFDEFWEDRYSQSQSNGTYSRWDNSVSNGLYSFDKWENTSTFDNGNNATIISSEYENVLKCATFTNASNQYCDSSDLDFAEISPGGEFLTGWNYRKQIDITGSSDGNLTNYKMEFLLHYENGTDYIDNTNLTNHIYLEERSNTDFSDIRFTGAGGGESDLIEHFFFDNQTSNYTYAWVEVPSIPASPAKTIIYLYYGNSGATSTTNSSMISANNDGFYSDMSNATQFDDKDTFYIDGVTEPANVLYGLGSWNGDSSFYVDTRPCQPAADKFNCYVGLHWNNSNDHQIANLETFRFYVNVKVETIESLCGGTVGCYEMNFNVVTRTNESATQWNHISYTSMTNTVSPTYTEKFYNDYTGAYQHTTPYHPSWDDKPPDSVCGIPHNCTYPDGVEGYYRNYGWWLSNHATGSSGFLKFKSNTTDYQFPEPDWHYRETTAYGAQLQRLELDVQGYYSQTSYAEGIIHFLEFAIINKTNDEPTITVGSSTIGLNYVGYLNNSVEYIGGINRFFPGVNVTEIATLEGLGAEVPAFEYFNFTMQIDNSNFMSGSSLEFFIYTFNDSLVLKNSTLGTWTGSEIQEFWNNTSQPNQSVLYTKDDNFEEWDGIYSFDLLELANTWFDNRLTSNTVLGIGVQLYGLNQATGQNITAQPNSNYVFLSSYFAFDYQFQVDFDDIASNSLSLQIEPDEEIISSVAFSYEKGTNSNLTQANLLTYEIAIETCSTCTNGDLSNTHFIRAILYDSSGDVYLSWRNIQGSSVSYDTGVSLEDNKNYRFTFEISKTDGRFTFSILDSSGDQVLRPRTWNSFTSDEVTNRPSFFGSTPLLENWSGNTSRGDHRRGYAITLTASSVEIVTGDTSFHIDQLYSSSGLLYTDWYCREESNNPLYTCTFGSLRDFDDLDAYTSHWYNLSTSTRGTFENNIRDFRSFSGIVQINSTDSFSNDQDVDFIRVITELEPIYENGTIGNTLTTSLTISNYTGGYNVLGSANDNISIPFWFPDLPGGKANVNFAFGYYFVDEQTIGLTVKYFDTGISTSVPVVATTYGNFDSELTQDVNIIVQYEIQFGNNYNTDGGVLNIREADIRRGRNLPFEIPSIPNPDVPYIPPSLLDNVINGLVGFTNTLLSGDIFGALGGVWDSILNLLGGIGGFFVSALFDFLIPWIQAGILLIWNWFVDITGTGDYWDLLYSLFNLLLLLPVLIWLFLVFLNFGFPFIYGLAGSPEQAPQRILDGIQKTWMFDASFGLASAVVPRIPLILVTIILTFIFGAIHEIAVIETINPF